MKKSINAWSFPEEYTFEECLVAAKKAGFDAIEFNLDGANKGHSFTVNTTDEDILAVKKLCESYGVLPISISSSLHHAIWSKTGADEVAHAMNILRAQLNVAKLMGSDTILVVPGGMPDGITLKQARANSLTPCS